MKLVAQNSRCVLPLVFVAGGLQLVGTAASLQGAGLPAQFECIGQATKVQRNMAFPP
jgi:hypothetical protein